MFTELSFVVTFTPRPEVFEPCCTARRRVRSMIPSEDEEVIAADRTKRFCVVVVENSVYSASAVIVPVPNAVYSVVSSGLSYAHHVRSHPP